jgi:hypothetical protein
MNFDSSPSHNHPPARRPSINSEALELGQLAVPQGREEFSRKVDEGSQAVVVVDELTPRTFEPLRNDTAAAVVVRGYLSAELALRYAHRILTVGGSEIGPYANLSDDLRKIGRTLFEATDSREALSSPRIQDYLDAAEGYRRKLSSITSEIGPWPMERIRHDLRRSLGAEPLRLMDREAFAGLVRIVAHGGQIKPHQDDLAQEFPELPFAARLSAPGALQIAGNLYLQLPDDGGALQLWNRRLTREELKNMRCRTSDYGIDETLVGAPVVQYTPKLGDLIFFDSTKLHAVSSSRGRERVSISFFMGISPRETRFWS